uniref:Uncharacterized protein n=1 Tax=Cucumis melo TaxID=3656 RepID=A0A9I9E5I0_CUCME
MIKDVKINIHDCVVRRDHQSGIDIDMIRVIRRDRSQPDCLSVSSGYTTNQSVLGVPLGSPKTNYVPLGSHVARVRERASSWVPLFRTLIGSEGKGRRKLASYREGSVTCHMGTQFCFRVYVSVNDDVGDSLFLTHQQRREKGIPDALFGDASGKGLPTQFFRRSFRRTIMHREIFFRLPKIGQRKMQRRMVERLIHMKKKMEWHVKQALSLGTKASSLCILAPISLHLCLCCIFFNGTFISVYVFIGIVLEDAGRNYWRRFVYQILNGYVRLRLLDRKLYLLAFHPMRLSLPKSPFFISIHSTRSLVIYSEQRARNIITQAEILLFLDFRV